MSKMFNRTFAGLGALALSMAVSAIALGQDDPVLTGEYGWEDGEATILGSTFAGSLTATNVGDFVHSGRRALHILESPHANGVPHVYVAHIRNLEDGDVVRAGFWAWDDTPGESPSVRIWAHYTIGGSVNAVAQAGGNLSFSDGIGWEELTHEWTFDSQTGQCNGNCDGLVIQVRLYSSPNNCAECASDYWVDDLWVEVYGATHPDLHILFPDDEPEPKDPDPPLCRVPDVIADYGWEDGKGTILGSTSAASIEAEHITDFVNSGSGALMLTESPHVSGAVHVYLAHIQNLQPGDIVSAGFWTWDETPGQGGAGFPSVRIWAHYTDGQSISPVNQAGGNLTYSDGIGWEELTHEWEFGDNPNWGGLVIQARLYTATCPDGETCSTDFFVDDLWIDVCAADPSKVNVVLPDTFVPDDPVPPIEPCVDADVTANYTWGDGDGTIIGGTQQAVITAANTTEMAFAGPNALKVTESPHHPSQNPQVWLAHIRNLQDGDRITGSFWTFDDTLEEEPGHAPSGYPSVRIWAHYTAGSSLSAQGQAGGNLDYSSGIGWEELSHTWEFDSNEGARDGLVIQARLYSPACPEGDVCSTDYFIDNLTVNVCANNPQNIIVLFPDAFVVEPPPPVEMCDDPLAGGFDWEDGKSTIMGANSSAIAALNVTEKDGEVFSGDHALKIVETGHVSGAREVYLALVENLAPGDTVRASFMTYDDTPGENPRVRIWGRYAVTGDPFLKQSAGGNEDFSSGIGWEELEHTWLFDPPPSDPPRNALMVMARVYSANCPEEEQPCVAEYFFDDLFVEACGDHQNLSITFADGSFVGEPGEPLDCVADVDGSGDIDLFDLFAVLGAWGTADPSADVNGDGLVDGADLGIVLGSFGPCANFLTPMRGNAQLFLEDTEATGGLRQFDLLVQLDPGEALVNVYDAAVTSSLGFAGGSFITIGSVAPHFDIAEDPNFDFFAFSSGTSLGTNAGWYNFDPSNNLGLADLYPENKVLVARLFVDPGTEFDAQLSVTYEDADGRARQIALDLAPDVPACPADLTGSGSVGVPDLLALLSCWGPVVPGAGCEAADLSGSGAVGVPDLLDLLSQWGPCPQ